MFLNEPTILILYYVMNCQWNMNTRVDKALNSNLTVGIIYFWQSEVNTIWLKVCFVSIDLKSKDGAVRIFTKYEITIQESQHLNVDLRGRLRSLGESASV